MGSTQLPPTAANTIVLVGDSTLDNVVWVGSYENCIKFKLESMNPTYKVVNYAADGFTSAEVVGGGHPDISWSHRKSKDPYPTEAAAKFCPLEWVNKLVQVDYIVLSVEGNDLRQILSSYEQIVKATEQFIKNYHYICDQLAKKCKKVILMMQYRPSYLQKAYNIYQALEKLPGEGKPEEKLNRLMEKIYEQIIPKAKAYKLPMIDLPNTFDIRDSSLYVSQIEPSSHGGQVIAKLITHVMQAHTYEKQLFYHINKQGQFVVSELDDGTPWRVTIDR